jgi:hypothetical protein
MIESCPLAWPVGYKRTKDSNRKWSKFNQTPEKAQKFLREEISRLGATGMIVSTNIPVRRDGYFYSDMAVNQIDDPGVAVYFRYNGKDLSMCADSYLTVTENLYAIAKSVEAIRAMERWGVSEFMERAFTGFKALPEEINLDCWKVLDIDRTKNVDLIRRMYKKKAFDFHPDRGGSTEKFSQLQSALEQALQYANS